MKATQKERVLASLRAGGTDLRDWPAGFRLAARIADLKADGYDIRTTIITIPGGTRCARYTLDTGTFGW